MRLAIISDIHGNMDALDEVLADIDKSNVDATICLGDMVGYGPEPEAVGVRSPGKLVLLVGQGPSHCEQPFGTVTSAAGTDTS